MQHLQPNTTLQGGKYRIERVLGQGGFGITYLARNTVFDIDVAIKEFFMKDENDRDGSSVTMPNTTKQELFHGQMEKFKKEAKRMFAIKNEHIVGVQDLFEENGTAYYVMDYVDGENLAERLKRTGKPMTEQEVRDILPQILDALKSIHEAGIWHLDLKPANIMIDKAGIVKLIDFGASKQLNTQKGGATTSTAISYTNGYAPREQMEQNYDKFGPWTDIYALGATLYNLLTNKRPPLPSDIDDDETKDKHQALPFSTIIRDNMKNFILQLMQTNRKKRPQSISEVMPLLDCQSEKIENFVEKPVGIKDKEPEDGEATIIATPKSEETIIEDKPQPEVKSEQKEFSQEVETNTSTTNNGNSAAWKIIGTIAVGIVAIILINNGGIGCGNVVQPVHEEIPVVDSIVEESPKAIEEKPQLTPTEEKIIGLHLFSLQWIESKYYGTCEITKEGEIYKCVALHESDNKKDYLKMDGNITIVSDRHLKFTGTIVRKVHYLYNGKEYKRNGTFDFKAWGSRKYWRGQNMDTPDGYDYIDIYFEKY